MTKVSIIFDAVTTKAQAGMKRLENSTNGLSKKFNTNFGQIGLVAGAAFAALGAGAVKAVSAFASFEQQMSKVKAITRASGEDFKTLENLSRTLGKQTAFSAKEAAEGMEFLGLAGFKTGQIVAALPGVLNLAAAGALDLGRAADITTDVMSQFGLEAEQTTEAVDIFAKAQSTANTNVEQLGSALLSVGGRAKSFGIDLADTSAALGLLADQGLKGQAAGTALNRFLIDLEKNKKGIEDLGISVFDSQGKFVGLESIINQISKATNGMTQEQAAAFKGQITGVFGAQALNRLLGAQKTIVTDLGEETFKAGDALGAYSKELKNSQGFAEETAKIMQDNLAGSFKVLQSAFSETLIVIGEIISKALRPLVKAITFVLGIFNILPGPIKVVLVVLVGVAAAFAALVAVTAAFLKFKGPLGGAFASVGQAATKATTKVNILSASIGKNLIAGLKNPLGTIKGLFGNLTSVVTKGFTNIAAMTKIVSKGFLNLARSFITTVVPTIISGLSSITVALLANPIGLIIAAIAAVVIGLAIIFRKQFGEIARAIGEFSSKFFAAIKPVIDIIKKGLIVAFKLLVASAKSVVKAIVAPFKFLASLFAKIFPPIKKVAQALSGVANKIRGADSAVLALRNAFITMIQFVLKGLLKLVQGLDKIADGIEAIVNAIPGVPDIDIKSDAAVTGIENTIQKLEDLKNTAIAARQEQEKTPKGGDDKVGDDSGDADTKKFGENQDEKLRKFKEFQTESVLEERDALALRREIVTADDEERLLAVQEFEAQKKFLEDEQEALRQQDKELKTEASAAELEKATEALQEHEASKTDVTAKGNLARLEITKATANAAIGLIAKSGSDGLKVAKAFQVTMATRDAFLAINRTLGSLPYPANLVAAAGIGIQAFGNVSSILSAQTGVTNVPGTGNGDSQPALLEPGEMVLTKSIAEGVRQGELTVGETPQQQSNTTNNVTNNNAFQDENDMEFFFRRFDKQMSRDLKQ